MERPERPSRHKSNPNRFPIRPTFSSDSESEPNDNDVPILTYYQAESTSSGGGPSTSNSQAGPAPAADGPSSSLRLSPPMAVTPRDEEGRSAPSPQDVARRKRTALSSAASVIFDSITTDTRSTMQMCDNRPDRAGGSPERFPSGEYVIRPKSFCNMSDIWRTNALPHQPRYKMKRFNLPMDLTPTTSNRESSAQPPVVTSSFSLQDSATLPTPSDSAAHSSFYSRNTVPPCAVPPRGSQPACSSILRQFDEMCSTNPAPILQPRRRRYVRFLESSRYSDSHAAEPASGSPLPASNRTTSLDDYCDLVGNFLFTYPSTSLNSQSTDNQRSPPVAMPLDRSEPASTNTADIIDRHAHSIISEINSYLDTPEAPVRATIDGGEPMEQSNDDVIVVETPERPPLPGSPDIVPSSRSPSPVPGSGLLQPSGAGVGATSSPATITIPIPAPPPTPPPRQEKAQSSGGNDVPLTLPELNQSLVALLECPVCLDHATPPIYQCSKGHILCQNCHPRLTSCPMCRSRLPGDRNSVMEKVAEKLMYPCKNTVTGCTMMLKLNDKQAHEEGCGFRHYACIVSGCSWKGYKPELVVHLQSNHPDKLITGTTKELHVPINGSGFVVHHWIQSAHNEVFHVVFNVDTFKRIMKGCVIYVGSREKAEKFEYLFQLKQRVSPFRKLSYSRTTHVDTLKQGQPLCLRDDFSINIDMAQLYRPADCCHQVIPVFITIAQLD